VGKTSGVLPKLTESYCLVELVSYYLIQLMPYQN